MQNPVRTEAIPLALDDLEALQTKPSVRFWFRCHICGNEFPVEVRSHDVHRYDQGMLAQEAFPYLSDGDRELMISGTCEKDFEDLFKAQLGEEEA